NDRCLVAKSRREPDIKLFSPVHSSYRTAETFQTDSLETWGVTSLHNKHLPSPGSQGKKRNVTFKTVLIVYAHQSPSSFNAAAKDAAVQTFTAQGYKVIVSDLYAMNFQPSATAADIKGKLKNPEHFRYNEETSIAFKEDRLSDDIKEEQRKVEEADLIIFQFPLYWFSVPAIMKGWIERVLSVGFAYSLQNLYDNGFFKNKKAMLSFTTGGMESMYFADGLNGDINVTLWPLQNGVLHFCGFQVLAPQIFWAVAHVPPTDRTAMLEAWQTRLKGVLDEQPLSFAPTEHFDLSFQSGFRLRPDLKETCASKPYGLSTGHHLASKTVLIVYAHQSPNSFNAAAKDAAVEALTGQGYKVIVSDLYAMNFNALATAADIKGKLKNPEHFLYAEETFLAWKEDRLSDDIKEEHRKVVQADLIIFQFPLYWFSYPAVMKGWMERVLTRGFAYTLQNTYDHGLCKGKKAVLSFTTGATESKYQPDGINGDVNVLLWPLHNGVHFCGFEVLAPQIFWGPARASAVERIAMLEAWQSRLKGLLDEQPLSFASSELFDLSFQAGARLKPEVKEACVSQPYGLTTGQHLGKPLPPKNQTEPPPHDKD
ncbi:hypothetical protein NFI96_013741, partial [Prochilodus magdalenae]